MGHTCVYKSYEFDLEIYFVCVCLFLFFEAARQYSGSCLDYLYFWEELVKMMNDN